MTYVYLGLGANIEPQASLKAGITALRSAFSQVQQSPVYRAPAVGMEGPDFLNMVVAFECPMSPPQLMHWIRTTEAKHGRQRPVGADQRPSSHGLDMDLLLFGDLVDAAANLPRPDILTCAYVLHPLADLAPDLVHPTKAQTMGQLKASYQFDQIVLPTQYQF
tara:strand:+ start:626 stop:1114 length:489 start_codon:yes stop_codon:yes gene_type:complete